MSLGGVVTTSAFNFRTEYLAGKDKNVKSEGFYATGSVRLVQNFDFIASFDYFNPNKAAMACPVPRMKDPPTDSHLLGYTIRLPTTSF